VGNPGPGEPQPPWARQWAEQWKSAGPALAAERRRRLAGLTTEAAAAAVKAVLDLSATVSPSPGRRATSGFVQQQALFLRVREQAGR
jgi:hypothetical protein